MRFWVEIAIAFLLTALIVGIARATDVDVVPPAVHCGQDVRHVRVHDERHGIRDFGTHSPSLVRHVRRHYASLNRDTFRFIDRDCRVRNDVIQNR